MACCGLTLKWKVLLPLLSTLLTVIYIKENLSPNWIYGNLVTPPDTSPCRESVDKLRDIVNYTGQVMTILDSLNITNFLLYGSLWGAYRFQGPLPWEYDSDIGIIDDTNYYEKSILVEALGRAGFRAKYKSWSSSYNLDMNETRIDIFVFKDYSGTMKRPGIEPSLAFLNYNVYHSFPTWMVQPPLPVKQFGWLSARVPRGGRNILEWLYPFSARKEVLPPECKRKGINVEMLTDYIAENVNVK